MSAVVIGGDGLLLVPTNLQKPEGYSLTATTTLNAAGESITGIGQLHISDRGSSKSLAGAKLWFRTGSVTFADAGTTLRVGIQDLNATGVEDGTFDIYKDIVGGSGLLLNNSWQGHVFDTGSKTVSHGDIIAISFETISRAGADQVLIQYASNQVPSGSKGFPYGTTDTGAGPAKSTTILPIALIEFSDGTYGRIDNAWCWTDPDQDTVSTTSQVGLYFVAPFTGKIDKVVFGVTDAVATTDMVTITVWGTPLGTPTSLATLAVQGQNRASTGTVRNEYFRFPTPISVTAGLEYAITIHATVGAINTSYVNLGTGNSAMRKITALGENWCRCTRTLPSSGAFSTTTTQLPGIGFGYSEIEVGGSSEHAHLFT